MGELQSNPDLNLLADLDPVIHAPARLMVLTYLYVVESADYVFLMHLTGLSWGNLATHLNKLEDAGYIEIQKTFKGKKPQSIVLMTELGRTAFQNYRRNIKQVLDELPD